MIICPLIKKRSGKLKLSSLAVLLEATEALHDSMINTLQGTNSPYHIPYLPPPLLLMIGSFPCLVGYRLVPRRVFLLHLVLFSLFLLGEPPVRLKPPHQKIGAHVHSISCCIECRYQNKLNTTIWVFPKMVVPPNGWFIMENPIKMDDLGVPHISSTSKISMTFQTSGNIPCQVPTRVNLQVADLRCQYHSS